MIRRLTYLAAYAALAALGEALVARPALLWVRSLGIFQPALAWDVPYGGLLLACCVLVGLFALGLAWAAARRRTPPVPMHLAFLLAIGICLALRSASGNPRPPRDPGPALLEAMRAAAAELDRGYRGRYAPDAGQFASVLAQSPSPGFRRLGRSLPLHARILSGAAGPQEEPLPGDQPGTLYVAISQDRQSAWLTALGLLDIVRLRSGSPAVASARRGTHSLPGGDAALPVYPGN